MRQPPNVKRDSTANTKWHTPNEMEKFVVEKVRAEPADVPGLSYSGVVTVKVLVGTRGDVVCMWNAAGHPIMIPNAVRAVHDWKFKPMNENGKAWEYAGTVSIQVSSKK